MTEAESASGDRPASSRRTALKIAVGGTALAAGTGLLVRRTGFNAFAERTAWNDERAARFDAVRSLARIANPIGTLIDNGAYGAVEGGTVEPNGTDPTPGFQVHTVGAESMNFKLFGGKKHLRYGDWQALSVSYPRAQAIPNTGRIAFMTDAPVFDLLVGSSVSAVYRVIVDGLYVKRDGVLTANANGARQFLHVTLANKPGAERKMRRVDVEIFSPEGSFGGVALPVASLLAPVPANPGYRIACFGDSLSAGTGCVNQNDGWNIVAGYLLGGVGLDMIQMALGGTGFMRNGPSWRASSHVRDVLAQPIDELWIALGMNDAEYSAAEVTAAALKFLQSIRRLLPSVPIVVFGIARDDTDRAVVLEQALRHAFTLWADRSSGWVPFQTGRERLFTGSVEGIGSFVASGYGGGVDGTDNTHPNVRGHLHMARFAANARLMMRGL